MQYLQGVDEKKKNVFYQFVYIEALKKVFVWKNRVFTYTILVKDDELVCHCWRAYNCRTNPKFFGKVCRHVEFIEDEFNFKKAKKPKTWLEKVNEEFVTMRCLIGGNYEAFKNSK